jgi:alpha-beta hydrolase superfamily lysophospholipase
MGILPGLDAVINDVAAKDQTSGLRRAARKRFLAAASMGGCLAVLYAIEVACPTSGEDVLSREEVNSKTVQSIALDRPRIDGLLLLCPLIDLSPVSIEKFICKRPLTRQRAGFETTEVRASHTHEIGPNSRSSAVKSGLWGQIRH